jgi:Right handed beta helix region
MSTRICSSCLAAATAAILMAVASPAPAVCVTDILGFNAALNAAIGSTTTTTIMVARGTYDASQQHLVFISNAANQGRVDIIGGYSHDCSTHINDPALTVLDGGQQSQILYLDSLGGFSVRYLTLQNGSNPQRTGLYISGAGVIFDYNIIRNNKATAGDSAGIYIRSGADIHVDGNLLVGNTASGGSFGAGSVITSGAVKTYVTNNTVVANTGGGYGGGLLIDSTSDGTAYASNNIFWNNNGDDVLAAALVLTNNDLKVFQGTSDPSSSGNLNVDPKFNPGAYSLAANSPLLGQGELAPPGGLPTIDIEGHPRSFMSTVDMGAYERGDKIFNYGFDQ